MKAQASMNRSNQPSCPDSQRITILGVGNILLKDEGVGVRVIERLDNDFQFPDNIRIVDGGVLGTRLMGIVADADVLIVVDAVQNSQSPGTLYRLAGDQVPRRVLAKQSLHQLDLPEVLALCSAIDHTPETIVIGIEPEDIHTMDMELTPAISLKMGDLVAMVLNELERLNVPYSRKHPDPSLS
jgi:hydrogenase maturation protease